MPLTGHAKKTYDQQRYQQRKRVQGGGDETRKLFPLRLKPSIIGWIRRIQAEAINTGRYPWQGTAELVEALLQRGLLSLQTHDDPLIDEIASYIQLQQQYDGIQATRRQAQVVVSRSSTEINALLGIGQKGPAAQYFHTTRRGALKMAPTAWRTWLVETLDKAFPELLKMAPKGIALTSDDGGDDVLERKRPRSRR